MKAFNKQNVPANKVKRNTVDFSHQVNATYQFGKLYPCMCIPVIPGDSTNIDVAFGLRAMPTAFPVQTKVKVNCEFFYVRKRNLWDGWQNHITNTGEQEVHPYLGKENLISNTRTSSLGDYLGLPSTVSSNRFLTSISNNHVRIYTPNNSVNGAWPNDRRFFIQNIDLDSIGTQYLKHGDSGRTLESDNAETPHGVVGVFGGETLSGIPSRTISKGTYIKIGIQSWDTSIGFMPKQFENLRPYIMQMQERDSNGNFPLKPLFNVRAGELLNSNQGDGKVSYYIFYCNEDIIIDSNTCVVFLTSHGDTFSWTTQYNISNIQNVILENADVSSALVTSENMPRISALPFRAYESIYNSFYRDERNNPFIVNGVAEPNLTLSNKSGGVDNFEYKLHNRNWEQDMYTTAVPSPQQGSAPLVGITSSGVASFIDNGNMYNVKLNTEDGDTVSSAEITSDVPNSVKSSILNMASSGFSISDFRGVNALQRWLEINMRRGLKYSDQIKSHFGVNVKYDTLDLPEFLGGVSRIFDTRQVDQNSNSSADPLGSYAGQLSAIGSNSHTINRYFDEHGYIIGILSIVPVPVYDQIIPKEFLKTEALDNYFPEFGYLGYQPILYSEVDPYGAILQGHNVNKTFGYQRAWYEYLGKVDTIHGKFRTSLSNFVITRKFDTLPSLNERFLTVHDDDINNVFTVTSYEDELGNVQEVDPFLGQIHFKMYLKRPIPLYASPRLE